MGLLDTLRSKGLLSGQAALDFTRGGLMGATTDLLGYPVDMATMAMRPFGYNVEKPVGGSEWLAGLLTSPSGSKMETAGRVVGGMLTPGPEDVARMTGLLAPKKAPIQELITYHGSPHRINNVDEANPVGKFDLSKVGTGEGAQAYGHGIYLAESPDVARGYKERLGKTGNILDVRPESAAEKEVLSIIKADVDEWGGSPELPEIMDIVKSRGRVHDEDALVEAARSLLRRASPGHFYTVDLPDEHIAKMLDWDAPLSEQPEAVRKALGRLAAGDDPDLAALFSDGPPPYALGTVDRSTGGQIYKTLADRIGGDAILSSRLQKLGIPGIKYFDGGSRAAGEGTRNFVIFDPDVAKILKRE